VPNAAPKFLIHFLGPKIRYLDRYGWGFCTVNTYFVPQGFKAPTWVMPEGPNSVITCRIDLKFGENASPDLADEINFESKLISGTVRNPDRS
jgi:hypothetical protein